MPEFTDRWAAYGGQPAEPAAGWRLETVVEPAVLGGANGIVEHNGSLLVTQVFGSQVTAIDTTTGEHRLFAPLGGGIAAPDDGVFGFDGTFFATEPMNATVSARNPDGSYRTVRDDLPSINGITMDAARRRLFADEFRPGGRLWELDPAGERPPTLLLDELMTPNALAVGPDNALWFPQVVTGEIWRYDLETRQLSLMFSGLQSPCAVKFDPQGNLVTPQSGSGEVTRISRRDGTREAVAELAPGIDNIAISPDGRLFVSHFTDGRVVECANSTERVLSPSGLVGPFGIAMAPDGSIVIADGLSVAVRSAVSGEIVRTHTLLAGLPTIAVAVAIVDGDPWVVGLRGQVFCCRLGEWSVAVAGRLDGPTGIAAHPEGGAVVVESGAGRVSRIPRGGGVAEPILSGLRRPHSVAVQSDGVLWVSSADGLHQVSAQGEILATIGELANGHGIAIGANGTIAVALPQRSEVVLYDPVSGHTVVAVRNAALSAPVTDAELPFSTASLAPAGDGWLLGSPGDGSIRRLEQTPMVSVQG